MKTFLTLAAGTALALTLSACEVRREGAPDAPATPAADATATPAASPSPEPSASASPAASIIREDAVPTPVSTPTQPAVEPVVLMLPFPDGSDISPAGERQLAALLRAPAIAREDWPVVLSGHTDSGGNDQANLRASRARAEAVAAWLVERGVDDGRIEVIAFGEQNPIAPNALPDGSPNEEGRRANRRVDIRVAPPGEQAEADTESGADDQDA